MRITARVKIFASVHTLTCIHTYINTNIYIHRLAHAAFDHQYYQQSVHPHVACLSLRTCIYTPYMQDGRTALHVGARYGASEPVMRLLLEHKANANAVNKVLWGDGEGVRIGVGAPCAVGALSWVRYSASMEQWSGAAWWGGGGVGTNAW